MVTKNQINRLKQRLEPGINKIDEVEIFLVDDAGTIEDFDGNIITEEEYQQLPGVEL